MSRPPVHRLVKAVGIAAGGLLVSITALILMVSAATKPVRVAVGVTSTVLGDSAELFSGDGGEVTGEELAAAAGEDKLRCGAAPPADPFTSTTAPTVAVQQESGDLAAEPKDPGPVAPDPILIGEGGSLSREDAQLVLDPLPEGSSALLAHVWFLYRLAGLGDWTDFVEAYEEAGLRVDEESMDAPLRQVQTLNTSGADVGRYRLTAAALVSAGELTGRFSDPYPAYRELVINELSGSCLSDSGVDLMTLPSPSTTTPAPAEPNAQTVDPAEPPTAGT
jgi:hypothetical protein